MSIFLIFDQFFKKLKKIFLVGKKHFLLVLSHQIIVIFHFGGKNFESKTCQKKISFKCNFFVLRNINFGYITKCRLLASNYNGENRFTLSIIVFE